MTDASALTRSWPALAAVGAGLVQLALGAGGVTATDSGLAERAICAALVMLGAAAIAWSGVTLAKGRTVVPGLGVTGALAGILACSLALATDPARISVLAAAAASLLLALVGGFCAVALRRGRRPGSATAVDGRTGIVGILIGAAAVAALVTPALAATEDGRVGSGGDQSVSDTHSH